jgi:predicted RNase H-like HicB family nuclease
MKRYLVIIEQTRTGYSAYSPDVDGCVSTAQTREKVEQRMRKAIEFHLEGLKAEGCQIPEPHAESRYIVVAI